MGKLFGKRKNVANSEEDTNAGPGVRDTSAGQAAGVSWPRRLRVGAASHIGLVRSHNEDALLVLTTEQLGGLAPPDPFGLFVLADGMGGHQSGEVASMLAVRTAAQHLVMDILTPYLDQETQTAPRKTISDAMCDAVIAADAAVSRQVTGGGTTLTCALIMGDRLYIAHVGDSRAYIFVDGTLRQVTQDHSLVNRLVEMGQISLDDALRHPQRNILYRAVGQGNDLEVDTYVELIPSAGTSNAQVLLCCDGLWGLVSDDQITTILSEAASPQEACEKLIEAANQAGGTDNITIIVIGRE